MKYLYGALATITLALSILALSIGCDAKHDAHEFMAAVRAAEGVFILLFRIIVVD